MPTAVRGNDLCQVIVEVCRQRPDKFVPIGQIDLQCNIFWGRQVLGLAKSLESKLSAYQQYKYLKLEPARGIKELPADKSGRKWRGKIFLLTENGILFEISMFGRIEEVDNGPLCGEAYQVGGLRADNIYRVNNITAEELGDSRLAAEAWKEFSDRSLVDCLHDILVS